MAGAMRRMGIYLGLVEDDDARGYGRYDSRQSDHGERDRRYGRYADDHYDDRYPDGHYVDGGLPSEEIQAVREPVVAVAPEPAPTPPQPYRITTLHPRTYNEARTIGERFRDGMPVIMNLTEMDDSDAKRLVDFAAGLSFGLRGSIERVTAKVFLISPQNVDVTAEDKARIREGGFFNQS